MNKVVLVGRLTSDPTGNEKYIKYSLAVKRRFVQTGKTDTDFINIVCFGKQAEFAGSYLKKGMKIGVVGRIQTGSYKAQDGSTRYTTDVIAEEHEFMESKSESSAATKSEPKQVDMNEWQKTEEEDLPFF